MFESDIVERLEGVEIKMREGFNLEEACAYSTLQRDFILKKVTEFLYLCFTRRKEVRLAATVEHRRQVHHGVRQNRLLAVPAQGGVHPKGDEGGEGRQKR